MISRSLRSISTSVWILNVYTLDRGGELTPIEDFGRVEDRKVCFRYTLYRNGSGSKYVLSNSEGLYYLPSYFGKAQMVDDMDSAKKALVKEKEFGFTRWWKTTTRD